jgi:hypothetical protein
MQYLNSQIIQNYDHCNHTFRAHIEDLTILIELAVY